MIKELEELKKAELRTPKGIKHFVYNKTNFKTSSVKRSEYVSVIEEWNGKLIRRVFAFKSKRKQRMYKDIQIMEVQREIEGIRKAIVKNIFCSLAGKTVSYDYDDCWYSCQQGYDYRCHEYPMYTEDKIIHNYNLQFCAYDLYTKNTCLPIDFFQYIGLYRKYPKVELLVKAGYSQFITGIRYLDLSAHKINEIFKVDIKWVPELKKMNINNLLILRQYKKQIRNFDDLTKFEEFINLNNPSKNVKQFLSQNMINYFNNSRENKGYLYLYSDYLKFAKRLGCNLSDKKVLFPEKLKEAHDDLSSKIKLIETESLNEKIKLQYEKFEKYLYEDENMIIKPVLYAGELINESKILNHCVRSYAYEVAEGNTEIMFIRKKEDVEIPFYTLELKGKTIKQVRGNHNVAMTKSVSDFVHKWAKENKLQIPNWVNA